MWRRVSWIMWRNGRCLEVKRGLKSLCASWGSVVGPNRILKGRMKPICIYYLKTGFCRQPGSLRSSGGECPDCYGQPVCQYYMQMGIRKFGAACKYDHPKHRIESSAAVTLNFYGHPLQEGEKECAYYIKMGQCKFSITCKFHHPPTAGLQVPAQLPGPGPSAAPPGLPRTTVFPLARSPIQSSQQYGIVPGNWPVAGLAMLPGSYAPGNYGPFIFPPDVVPVPDWTPYPVVLHEAAHLCEFNYLIFCVDL